MRPPSVGTWAWAELTGGALSAGDRRALWSIAVRGELRRVAAGFAARFDTQRLDLDGVVLPDSALAQAVRALCEQVSSPALVRHCVRTYVWGALLGQRMQLGYDAELLFVTSLLHDLGLTHYAAPNEATPCFAVAGARAAHAFLREQGVAAERAVRAAECITLHMNPHVLGEHSPEAQLMAAGAHLDAVGTRAQEIPAALRQAVLWEHPNSGIACELIGGLQPLVAAWPNTRAAFLDHNVGLLKRIARSRI